MADSDDTRLSPQVMRDIERKLGWVDDDPPLHQSGTSPDPSHKKPEPTEEEDIPF